LLAYTTDAARASSRLNRVIVSTDDEEIAGVARQLGVEVPFLRPQRLAADEAPMLDVLVDLVHALQTREQYKPDLLVLLQPTSPFRRAERIDEAVDLLTSSGADSVVTVLPVPHQFSPSSIMRLEGNRLVAWAEGPAPTRRQDKPLLFARNGPAVLAVRASIVADARSLYGADTRGLVMSRQESLDIDDAFDLELAGLLMNARTV
jgi:CMP-N,N'-diacetyllegionaminic acid synthase